MGRAHEAVLACYGDYRRLLAVVLIGSVLSAVLETLFPMVVRHILDVVLPSGNLADLFRYGLGLLGLYIVCLVLTFSVYGLRAAIWGLTSSMICAVISLNTSKA